MNILLTKRSGPLTLTFALVLLGLFSSVMLYFLDRIEEGLRTQWGQSLSAVLETTNHALHHWEGIQKEMVTNTASNPQLVALVEALLALPRDKAELEASFELDDLRKLMLPAIKAYRYTGFRVITSDHFVIAARHPRGVATAQPLGQYGDYLDRALAGEVVMTPPFAFKHPLYQGALRPALFAVAPIRNQKQEIIAALALHIEPTEKFATTGTMARMGESGDSYFFDRRGRVLSPLRFENELQAAGILQPGQPSLLTMSLHNPGIDIRRQPLSPADYSRRPLTRMANAAIQGSNGLDIEGYQDYRGVNVIGAWHWDADMGFGIAVELDEAEALGPYRIMRSAVLSALGFGLALMLVLLALLFLQRRAAYLNAETEARARREVEQAYAELSDSQELNQLLLESSAQGIYGIDRQGRCIFVNPSCLKLLGYSEAEELLGKNIHRLVHHSHPDGSHYPEENCPIRLAFNEGDGVRIEDDVFWRKDGSAFPVEYHALAMKKAGEIVGVVTTFSDITERKNAEQYLLESKKQLEEIAYFDPLTGLPNRRLMVDRLKHALAAAERSKTQVAVCYLDLDGFKPVNDKLGHDAGDRLLREVANRLSQTLRQEDTVSRIGGDEFVLIIGSLKGIDECTRLLQRVLEIISSPYPGIDGNLPISVSIGVTLYPDERSDADTLLRHADQTMYLAKQSGKNRYQYFDPRQDQRVRAQLAHLERIEQAIDAEEMVLHYQPKLDMRHGTVEGVEVLVRWQHPEMGLLPPSEFLPLIENSELSVKLDQWVVSTALQQLSRWNEQGLKLELNLNISPRSLQRDTFISDIIALLEKQPTIKPEQIILEILESSALDDLVKVTTIMQSAKEKGIRFALDDFGTGYSSLTYFRRLPVTILKVDQSFIRDMLEDSDDFAVVQGIINLAKAFGMEVIAEGVETEQHGVSLLQLGCDIAQGYGIARPMPAEELVGWIEGYRAPASWQQIDAQH